MTNPKNPHIDKHPAQKEIAEDKTRFKVVVSGRRWGKSYLGVEVALHNAFHKKKSLNWIVCPTREMARDIHWDHLKERVKELHWKTKINETSLSITRLNDGSKIILKTADNPDRLRGRGLDFIVIDEFRDMEQWIWGDVLRPALTDKKGNALFISTPNGKDVLYDLYLKGVNGEEDWKSWHYKTIDSPFIDNDEIEQAKKDLDTRTYQQEYEADFETGANPPYYAYSNLNHKTTELRTDKPFILTCDFNRTNKPMSWAFGQRMKTDVTDDTFWKKTFSNKFTSTQTQCEIVWEYFETLPLLSNTLYLYGDYSGKSLKTNSEYSDWEIIEKFFANKFMVIERKTKFCKSIADSISATNSQLCNMNGVQRQFIDYDNCKELRTDWTKAEWADNGKQLYETESVPELCHMCRAVDYYNDYEHSIKGKPEAKWNY